MAILALLAAAAAASAAPSFPDPLGPAAVGKVQCFSPDLARKVCAAINAYSIRADGQIADSATVIVEKTPLVEVTTVTTAIVANGRVCSVMKKDDLLTTAFTVNGVAPSDTELAQLRGAIANGWAALVDHSVCVSFVPDGSQFVAHTAFDGLPRPSLDQRVMWVAPQDGWKVAP